MVDEMDIRAEVTHELGWLDERASTGAGPMRQNGLHLKADVPVGSVIEDDALDLDQARMEMSANMLFPDLRSQIDGHEIELDPT